MQFPAVLARGTGETGGGGGGLKPSRRRALQNPHDRGFFVGNIQAYHQGGRLTNCLFYAVIAVISAILGAGKGFG